MPSATAREFPRVALALGFVSADRLAATNAGPTAMEGPLLSHCMVDGKSARRCSSTSSTTQCVAGGIRSTALTTRTRSCRTRLVGLDLRSSHGTIRVSTFAYALMLSVSGSRGNHHETWRVGEHPGVSNTEETPAGKANVTGVLRTYNEKIGSSGWIRTSNPPVNRRKKRR